MAATLIIGYGNPLRCDDSLGWRVAELVAECPGIAENPDVEIHCAHQLTPELAELVAKAGLVIFIDAAVDGPPGSWRCEAIEANSILPCLLGHHFTPARLLAYASAIFGRRPKALLVSVAAQSFAYGEHLTPAVKAALPEVARSIYEQIENGSIPAAAPISANNRALLDKGGASRLLK